ncbi:thioredoxin-disulfide reductase [Jiulongibacter sediminis]|uniref:Thioredoxin reductase n=1 Tax=Jiulongibacter sediminis TaxID=1605367 RepID=A0A0P7C775_9BACT|nr:thioredoxin-disulfide reductase [Jiulongibacter sediminis]KPM49333.1 thioredoxin reductase [Jiulongibacter sediminis]TBX26385.1 thioredoxin reductase [Jiulongibacter sediminis]
MTTESVEVLILGSGPAGYTAAIYAGRAGLKPVMYQGSQPGGQLTITNDVENFPGYPEGIQGPAMMEELRAQAERFGLDNRYGMATSVDFSIPLAHKVIVDENHEITAKAVIIATGASAKWLNIESEQRLNGLGVSACAVCDGFFYRGQDVVVVGAGDTACEEAHYLSKLCNKVTMLVRKDHFRASTIMESRVRKTENIEILFNTETVEVLGDEGVTGVKVVNNQTKEESVITATGFFVAIGHKPNTDIFKGFLDMDETGYLEVEKGTSKTNIEGVFASGDAMDKVYRQAVTAAGTGCMAALDAERYLAAHE